MLTNTVKILRFPRERRKVTYLVSFFIQACTPGNQGKLIHTCV